MVLKYLLISKSLCNINHFSVSQLFIQYWWIFTQSLLLSPPHIFGTVSPITVVQAQISRILGVTYITITKTFLVLNVRQFFKHFKQWVLPGHFAPILLLVVSTLRNPCHDLCYSICKLDRHHSFSAVFPPAASVMPFMSPHFFWGERPAAIPLSRALPCKQQCIIQVQWPVILQCFGESTVQQLQESKLSSTIPSSFYAGSLSCGVPHLSCCQDSESQDVTLCLSAFPTLVNLYLLSPRFSFLTGFQLLPCNFWHLSAGWCSYTTTAQVPHSHTFYFYPTPDHLLLDTRVRPPLKDSDL